MRAPRQMAAIRGRVPGVEVVATGYEPGAGMQLLERMRGHIHTVAGRYRGRVQAWDVVNEALNEDGTLRQSPWLRIIGEDQLEHAFRFAHEVDPAAELYYNDDAISRSPGSNRAKSTHSPHPRCSGDPL